LLPWASLHNGYAQPTAIRICPLRGRKATQACRPPVSGAKLVGHAQLTKGDFFHSLRGTGDSGSGCTCRKSGSYDDPAVMSSAHHRIIRKCCQFQADPKWKPLSPAASALALHFVITRTYSRRFERGRRSPSGNWESLGARTSRPHSARLSARRSGRDARAPRSGRLPHSEIISARERIWRRAPAIRHRVYETQYLVSAVIGATS